VCAQLAVARDLAERPGLAPLSSRHLVSLGEIRVSRYWSIKEAAEHYGVGERALRRLVADGRLEFIRVRGAIRIPKAGPGYSPLVQVAAKRAVRRPKLGRAAS
jgi:excisionase family DNA binding protein